jgi:hypothetical protein
LPLDQADTYKQRRSHRGTPLHQRRECSASLSYSVCAQPAACMTDGTPASARSRHAWRRSHPYPRGIPAAQKLCTHGPSHRRAKRRIAFRLRQRGHFSARVGSLLPPVAHSCIGVTELISLAPRAQPPSWPQPARLLMCARVWPASTLPGEAARQRGSARRRFRLGAGGARGWEARRTEILPNSLREASGGKQGTFSIGLR